MYPKKDEMEKDQISMEDTANQFPEWYEAWKHAEDENYHGKYTHVYMGFGNGLNIDNSIYEEYKLYLDEEVKKNLEKYSDEEKETMQYAAIFNVWEEALIKMANDKNYIIEKAINN